MVPVIYERSKTSALYALDSALLSGAIRNVYNHIPGRTSVQRIDMAQILMLLNYLARLKCTELGTFDIF